jgi:pappalysin-1
VCKPEADMETSWGPCGHSFSDEDYWIDVTFERAVVPAAVVLYIASDGQTKYSEMIKTVEVRNI